MNNEKTIMDELLELNGTVERLLFQNEETGYAVLVLSLSQNQSAVVRGYVSSVHAGESVTIKGSWTTHPKFGKQFEASSCTTHVPTSVIGLKKYLGSGLIKGIGPVYAERLVNAFGVDVLNIIDKEPQALSRIPGIGPARAEKIIKSWQDQKEISQVMVFLQEKGISPAYAVKIYKTYGAQSIAKITENPYRIADDIWGIGFKMADQIAQNMGVSPQSLQRVKSAIQYAISQQNASGSLYGELNAIKQAVIELLEFEPEHEPILKAALHDLYNEGKIKLITHQEAHYITLSAHYFAEKGAATKILNLLQQPSTRSFDIDKIYQQLRTNHTDGISLNEDQQRGVLACLQNKMTVITGGPGTGKTTLIKKLLQILDEHDCSYRLAAPTGRAAKRITQGSGRHALTIHRLLEYDVTSRGFTRNESNALKLDFLIIDEASMIDVFLAHAILKAMPFTGHLICIGDSDQLPSVGAGNFLSDVIASEKVACIKLKEIFRQAQDSLIITNAHRVNTGEFPISHQEGAKKDFIFIKEEDPTLAFEHIKSLYKTVLPRQGISVQDAMVLVPMNRGIVGTQKLNQDLQGLLNPSRDEKHLSYGIYRYQIGDQVMQIKNNYDKHIFNGDIGIIQDLNISDRVMKIRFDDKEVEYESSEFDELVLAYAISVHKSQGSEYPAVILPIYMNHFTLLQRNLVYTAITRAKKLCIVIGQPRALAMAIKNNKGSSRTTFLTQYLTSDLQCR